VSHPPIRSYVLRQGRFSPGQQRAYAELLPRYGVEYRAQPLDFKALFGDARPVVVEIGSGMGQTTAAIAAAHPEVGYLAIEVHSPGVGCPNQSRTPDAEGPHRWRFDGRPVRLCR